MADRSEALVRTANDAAKAATYTRIVMARLISELVARAIESENDATAATPFSWVTKDLQPRVDIEDKDALRSALDER